MKITYLGTGAAEGIPAQFCHCPYCERVRKKKFKGTEVRSRAQVLLDGELSVDFSPDAFYHSAVLGADLSAIRYLVVTHSHMDHFYAHDFVLRGYKYAKQMTVPRLEIYGNEEVCEVYRESVRREMREEIGAAISLHPVDAYESFSCGEWTVYPLAARHTSVDPLVFLFEKGGKRYLHLSDTGVLPEENDDYLRSLERRPVDLITFDCTFLWESEGEHLRHMGLKENETVFRRLEEIGLADGHTQKVITHFSHNVAPTSAALRRAEREYGVIAAYDGMSIEI